MPQKSVTLLRNNTTIITFKCTQIRGAKYLSVFKLTRDHTIHIRFCEIIVYIIKLSISLKMYYIALSRTIFIFWNLFYRNKILLFQHTSLIVCINFLIYNRFMLLHWFFFLIELNILTEIKVH